MKNKKIVTLLATLGLITCLYNKVDATIFYDTLGTRYEGAVERLGELEIINGVSEKAFEPNRNITRAEFAKMIVEATLTEDEINALIIDDSNCNFRDVYEDEWYYKYVVAATNYGYISGYQNNTFRPNKNITYEEISKMLMKALGHNYLVETDPRGWSAEYMEKMYLLNIADGTANFDKKDSATRGNVAILLWNTLTNNVWEKIKLNDQDGFTYVDSGRTLFSKKIDGHIFGKDLQVEGFSEINGRLCVKLNGKYYRIHDEEATVLFTMLGGKAEGMFKYVRYPQNVYRYEIVGLSSDIGSQLYSGYLTELKADGFSLNIPTENVGKERDFGYLLEPENEEDENRLISINSDGTSFYVEKIEINEKSEDVEEDDEETVKKILEELETSKEYIYIDEDEILTKTITINEEYEIQDGAVLFENNKRVTWDTVEEGDVITEIKKDEYYFLSRKTVEATLEEYTFNKDTMKTDGLKFSTSEGNIIAYYDAAYLEYYAKDEKTFYVYKLGNEKLDDLVDLKLKFYLDFAGKAVRIEVLEEPEYERKEIEEKDPGLGYFVKYNYSNDDKNNNITLIVNGKEKLYMTTLKSIGVELGELVSFELNERNQITKLGAVSNNATISDKLKLNTYEYEKFNELIEKEVVTNEKDIYLTTYYYDFGQYEKIIDFKVKKIKVEDIKNINHEKSEYYVLADDNGFVKTVLIKDFSEKKEIFYGIVDKIYLDDDDKLKIDMAIFEYKDITFDISGLLNCEEGDVVSFKMLDEDTIKILEKFNINAMGYYKDIIIKDTRYNRIAAENGEIDLKEGKIITEDQEYLLSQYTIMFVKVKKDEEGKMYISGGKALEVKDIDLEVNDRIAIDEIEDTVIIYRGYEES